MAERHESEGHIEAPPGSRVVLVAVDGSSHANFAFDWYLENVRSDKDYVILINSPELGDIMKSSWNSSLYIYDKNLMSKMIEEEHKTVDKHLKYYKDKLTSIGAKGKVKVVAAKAPGHAICQAAIDENAEIIIIGTRGMGKIRRTLTGSVSDYVLHHAHVPVLVCRHKHHDHDAHHEY